VLRFTPAGARNVVFNSGETFVWALDFDAQGRLLIGTGGTRGALFRVQVPTEASAILAGATATASAEAFARVPERHIRAISVRGNDIFVGSGSEAVLYQIDGATGAARALFQVPEPQSATPSISGDTGGSTEFSSSFSMGGGGGGLGGVIYLLMAADMPSIGSPRLSGSRSPGAEVLAVSAAPDGVYFGTSLNGTVYRWSAERGVVPIYSAPQAQSVYALRRGGDGHLYAATGDKGMVYQIRPSANPKETDTARLIEATQLQALALSTAPNGDLVVGTGNNAAAYRVSLAQAGSGLFTSNVFDAKNTVRWGALRLVGSGASVETRSGNTLEPDTTWSAWQPATTNELGELRIASPPGRYLQYRARLAVSGNEAQLSRLEIAFRASNTAPALILAAVKGGEYFRTKQKLTWAGQDTDSDTLRYRLWLSDNDGSTWKAVELKDNSSNSFELDTTKWRDGVYRARVEVSDAVSNPDDPQSTTVTSLPFTIDNTAPRISGQGVSIVETGKSWTLRASAGDDLSPIAGAEWRFARPAPVATTPGTAAPGRPATPAAGARAATPSARQAATATPAITLANTASTSGTDSSGGRNERDAGWTALAAGDGILDSRREDLIGTVEVPADLAQDAKNRPGPGSKIEVRVRDAAGNVSTVTLTLP
jgi:hypothetical protein